ncbi:uncharacterized protein TNCT_533951 [Trichonephila clavata]|uniref:Endonuclease/exonuclease/phosphatase domain-containing protein n=1 Tax=Trichonephila clavata TaxID=2740835 RepID=A0A8X6F8W1_TRICU|nr:uncharacterized protein TNCT_533951 [Trichonephila clavata]
MPRKTSQRSAAIAEAKNEGNAPRRSGRAVTKQETSAKEASRSRRSSTAAQTAASVADSKAPKGKGSSRRESSSPSDARGRTGSETPATRVKSTRRSTGRVNYKESDGEEEVPTPKYDENFESGDDLEDSDSDDKSKSRGKGRVAKAKGQTKSKGASRSRRGRPSKKKEEEEEEENETFDVSDDSVEPEEVPVKRGRTVKEKETVKPARSRRQRSEVTESKPVEEKSRPTRRSGRTSSNKEESPKKRPSRGLQAKRYAEEEDDDIEEISDSKADEDEPEEKESEGRKRKRDASPEEANKRLKEDVKEDAVEEVVEDKKEPVKDTEKNDADEKSVEEPMEIDESDSANVSQVSTKTEDVKEENVVLEKKEVSHDTKKEEVIEEKMEQGEKIFTSKEKPANSDKQVDIESSKSDDNKQPSDFDTGNQLDTVVSESDNLHDTKENVENDHKIVEEISENQSKVEATPLPTESSVPVEEKSEKSKILPPVQPSLTPESATEKITDKNESSVDIPAKVDEISRNDGCVSEVKQSVTEVNLPVTPVPVSITLPKEPIDAAFNGAEKSNTVQNSTNEIHSTSTVNANVEHIGNSTPKANGAHNDVQHTNSSSKDQYYLLPGRKYVSNPKLNESLKQSIKNHMFGFVSFNLGTPDSDAYLQKEKLLNELGKLDAHVICLQQVAKQFYNAVLEPSLDALGFKSVFSQPEDSLKGMATFYKSSLFRLSGKSDVSLKELIEMEVETSSLNTTDKEAVRTHIRRCGSVLFTHFSTIIGTQTITIANVQIPRSDFSSHALQISCLAQEVVRVNGGTNKPLLLGGEFNIAENDASYQLLRDGYLSNEMIEELQQRKDVVLPGRENDSLLNLLWKSFQHPSSNLCSCYHSVLGHEFVIPELKTASPDLLWYSSDSLHTVGVLDVVSDKVGDHHLSLKADIAFSV